MPRKQSGRMPSPTRISIERDGKTYHGTYTVNRGMITVSTVGGTKTTHVGNLPVETLAGQLLSELVQELKRCPGGTR